MDPEDVRKKQNENLKPFTKDNQPPGCKKSRKGIPNKATVLKFYLKEAEKRQRREELAAEKRANKVTHSDQRVT